MNPIVYKNVKSLTYRELLEAISNIKNKMQEVDDKEIINRHSEYYEALVKELDNRQKEQI